MKKLILLGCAAILCLAFAQPAAADSDAMLSKLKRGASNLVTGVFEIPAHTQMEFEKAEDSFLSKGFHAVGGLFKGVGMGVARTLVGGLELLTFPIGDGEPLIEPRCVFEHWSN